MNHTINHTKHEPLMLRTYHDSHKGATAFFRNRPFLDELVSLLLALPGDDLRILVHACSVGAEPYSIAMWWQYRLGRHGKRLQIYATDIDSAFLDFAKAGVYPENILSDMTLEERAWFDVKNGNVCITDKVKSMVSFLPAMSFVADGPGEVFDAVLIMNALTYVTPEQQTETLGHVAAYAKDIICATAFHPDSIQADIDHIGFRPFLKSMEKIHSAWGDRLTDDVIVPGSAAYSWRLPRFNTGYPDYEYRYCSIFTRKQDTGKLSQELMHALENAMRSAIHHHQSGDISGAEVLYGKVLEIQPTHAVALHNLGLIYLDRENVAAAVLLFGEAVRQRPGEAAFQYGYALALQRKDELAAAEQSYLAAVKINPQYREAWENLGVVQQDQGLFEDAIAAYRQALRLTPSSRVANKNLGNVLRALGRHDEAIACYEHLLADSPLDAEIALSYGMTLLAKGDFASGWPWREWRFWSPEFLKNSPPCRVPLPRWAGEPLHGKSLLIYGEQGVGDEIMFASCFGDVTDRADNVRVVCDPRLVDLFARSFPALGFHAKPSSPQSLVADGLQSDVCMPAGSLPAIFRPDLSAFTGKPYLVADSSKVSHWRTRLDALPGKLKIGISWRGGIDSRAHRARSIPLEVLSGLLNRKDATFINVQYGAHAEEIDCYNDTAQNRIVSFSDIDPLQDMDNFAAMLSALDLVISVDNSTVHLAGALGVKTWVLLPLHADWRWLRAREDTPWYSSVRVFRQVNAGWEEAVENVARALDIAMPQAPVWANPNAGLPQSSQSRVPHDARPSNRAALLINDTAHWYHWGCSATSLAMHEQLRNRGYRVDSVAIGMFNQLAPLPASLEDFDDPAFYQRFSESNADLIERIRRSEYVIVNGEGSIHGLRQVSLALLYTIYLAKRWLNKNSRIINHSGYPALPGDNQAALAARIYAKVYGCLDFVASREHYSVNALAEIGIRATDSFDCLPLFVRGHSPAAKPREQRVVVAGAASLTPDFLQLMVNVVRMLNEQGYRIEVLVGASAYLASDDVIFVSELQKHVAGQYTLVAATSESAWLDTLNGAAALISGRFHHSIAAACLGTPLLVASSNTFKIEGLLARLNLNLDHVWLDTNNLTSAMGKIERALQMPELATVSPSAMNSMCDLAMRNFDGLGI